MDRGEDGPQSDRLGARLLAAAAAEFADKGYAGARVAGIARRAGVTTGAIYSRYRGKADLLAAALTEATEGEFEALFEDQRFNGRMEDVLRVAASHLLDRAPSDGGASVPGMLLESFTASRHEPEVKQILQRGMGDRNQRLADIVEAAKAGGGMDPGLDTDAVVTFCNAVGLGFLLLEAVDAPLPDATEWERLISRLVAAVVPPS